MNNVYSVIDPIKIIFFSSGLLVGLVLFCISLLIIIRIGKKKSVRYTTKVEPLGNERLNEMSISHKALFREKNKGRNQKVSKNLIDELYEILKEISSYYFPESKTPIYEITIDEALGMINEITASIEYFIDKKYAKLIGKINVAKLYDRFMVRKDENIVLDDVEEEIKVEEESPKSWFKKMIDTVVDKTKKVSSSIMDKSKDAANRVIVFGLEIVFNKLIDISIDKINSVYSSKTLVVENKRNRKKKTRRERRSDEI